MRSNMSVFNVIKFLYKLFFLLLFYYVLFILYAINCGDKGFYYELTVLDANFLRILIMVALCNSADHYIFALWFLSSSIFFLLFLA